MTALAAEEKTKPFRPVKYFTFISLFFLFAGTLILSVFHTRLAREMQFKKNEGYAHVLVENLNHQIFSQFILPFVYKYGKTQLREPEQFERMDQIVRNTLYSFQVEVLNIYDLKNTISYSFDKDLLGLKDLGGVSYQKALQGESTSRLSQRGTWWELLIGAPKESKIITFAPLRAEYPLFVISGPVLGIMELVQDVSADYKAIYKYQIQVISIITVVMGSLFIVLIFVVKQGEEIIRKRALERLRLKEQLGRAEHLSRLGEMVAAVSHEIRNPLGIIMSSAELMQKKVGAKAALNSIAEIIVEEAGRLNLIITDFLNYARPKMPQLVSCRIDEILDKNIERFTSDSENNAYEIKKGTDGRIPKIAADPDMLYQAFLNLLLNAKQAMPQGGRIHLHIGTSDQYVKIRFEDEGTGIPQDVLAKIWDPFFTTKETGTGLGLGIVKNIVETHHGHIHIDNRVDKGARVVIKLPIDPE